MKRIIFLMLPTLFLGVGCAPDLVDIGPNGIFIVELDMARIEFDFSLGKIRAQNLTAERIRVQVVRVEYPNNFVIFDHCLRGYDGYRHAVEQRVYIKSGMTLQVNVYRNCRDNELLYSNSFRFR